MGGWMQLGLDGMYGMGPARVLRPADMGEVGGVWVWGWVGLGHVPYCTCMHGADTDHCEWHIQRVLDLCNQTK